MTSGTSGAPDPLDSAPSTKKTGADSGETAPSPIKPSVSDFFPPPEEIESADGSFEVDEPTTAEEIPETIGRYEVIRKLGSGGFGCVYLAHDPKLNRKVAIKLPLVDLGQERRESFVEEGRSVARLAHPSIVGVFDILETEDGDPFVIMEFVKGPTLRTIIEKKGLTFSKSIKYMIQLAEALEYAHSQTLIHRDIKPANVVISLEEDRAKLMDFGLAIHDLTPDEQIPNHPEGTPPYMSPEQVRGENHRLDRRTDIWAFGILMYIMLTGRKPFRGDTLSEVVKAICLNEPKSPRKLNGSVPVELERICLKCLEKLMSSRYQTTQMLVEDLRSFENSWIEKASSDPSISSAGILPTASELKSGALANSAASAGSMSGPDANSRTVRVVPKGLRSFDGGDAEFFIDLLPGPKDRFGVPESLRFWSSRLSLGAEEPLPVGMVFGPSGCGKSSFVKAGLIPRLVGVKTVYVEAAPNETEKRIFEKLSVVAPAAVRDESELVRVFARLRRGQLLTGDKMLIVIDQFEQWLHMNPDLTNQELIHALRQCDGENLSCLLLVRDDFWMSATEFMAQLDLKVQEGVNALGIPLFDRRHARRVLTAYGRANEAFGEDISPKQRNFVSNAVSEMSENGRVIPIHLALFSQMMDSDSWDSGKLKKMGGWKGLGVHFLESIFSEKRAQPYEETCRDILASLLPGVGSKIKGSKKSFRRLLETTNHSSSKMLQDSLDLLDRELRIITPTESDVGTEVQNFQLAHDYLVEPIRDWLTQKAKETRQGRARMRMEELSVQWAGRQEKRFLPSLFEYSSIRTSVNKRTCTSEQTKFIRAADKYWTNRFTLVAASILAFLFAGWALSRNAETGRLVERFDSLLISSPGEVKAKLELLEQFDGSRVLAVARNKRELKGTREKIHTMFVRARFEPPEQVDYQSMINLIKVMDSGECGNVVEALRPVFESPVKDDLVSALANKFDQANAEEGQEAELERFRIAVVAMHLGDTSLAEEILDNRLDPTFRSEFIANYRHWRGAIGEAIELIKTTRIEGFQTGLCCALGQIPKEEYVDSELENLAGDLSKRILKTDSSEVHSVCRWLLEQLKIPLPDLQNQQSVKRNWFVKNLGSTGKQEQITFIRIGPQTVYRGYSLLERDRKKLNLPEPFDVQIKKSFHISAREISASLFFQFVDSLPSDHPLKAKLKSLREDSLVIADLPAFNLQWREAVMFCNWLSAMDGLRPWYEVAIRKIKDGGGELTSVEKFEKAKDGNGYRLPTDLEWEAASRGGSKSRYFFGQRQSLTGLFAVTGSHKLKNQHQAMARRGLKMPNRFGIFDIAGNASEWCNDWPDISEKEYLKDHRSVRGGCLRDGNSEFLASSFTYTNVLLESASTTQNRYLAAGIRLVIQLD